MRDDKDQGQKPLRQIEGIEIVVSGNDSFLIS